MAPPDHRSAWSVLGWLGVLACCLVVRQSASSPLQPSHASDCAKSINTIHLPTVYTIHSAPVPTIRRYIRFTPPPGATECLFSLEEVFGDTAFLNSSSYVQYFFHNEDPTNARVAVHTTTTNTNSSSSSSSSASQEAGGGGGGSGSLSHNPFISADVFFQNCTGDADAIAAVASVVDVVALLLWSEVPIRIPEGPPDTGLQSLLCSSVEQVATYLMVNTRSFDSCPFVFCRRPYPLMHQMALVNASIAALPPEFPQLFPNLSHLELTQNFLEEPPRGFPWNSEFQRLPHNLTRMRNFHKLYTANNLFQLPRDVFKRQLVLDKNRITDLSDFEFSGCLDVLAIQWNGLSAISNRTFANLTCLTFLNLNGNNLTEIPPHALDSLGELRNLILSKNKLTEIGEDVLGSLTQLITLDLADNLIADVSEETFASLQNLETLKMQNNRITSIRGDVFKLLTKLSVVDLSGNPIHTFPYDMTFSMEGLRSLSLTSTAMTVFNFSEICNMDLSVVFHVLQDGSTVSHVAKQVRKVDLSNSTIRAVAIGGASARRCQNTMKVVLCAFQFAFDSNPLHCDPSIFAFLEFLETAAGSLDIPCTVNVPSGLVCASPEELRGRPLVSVQRQETYGRMEHPLCPRSCRCYRRQVVGHVIVDCRGRGLGPRLPPALPPGPLELWLQDNNVTALEPRPYLSRVLTLNLSGNALQELAGPGVLEALEGARLRRLSLADNLLASLPRRVARLRLERLELQGNPFRCDCRLLWLKAWIRSRPPGLERRELIKCSAHDGEGQQLQLVEDEDFVCVEVDELRLGLQSGLPSGALLALLAAAVACYLRRQELKVWLYVHTGWHPLDRDEKAGQQGEEGLDACVLCEEELDAWTFGEVSWRLEREWGYRVFHLWRDVGLGEALHESAARAAGRSARLVVVLEAGAAPRGAWLGAALQQALAPGRQRSPHFLVLVVRGGEPRPPVLAALHPQLQRYIKARRYVNARAPRMFSRLMYHMPQKAGIKERRRMLEARARVGADADMKPEDGANGTKAPAVDGMEGRKKNPLDEGKIIIPDILAEDIHLEGIPAVKLDDVNGQDLDSGVFDILQTEGDVVTGKAGTGDHLQNEDNASDVQLIVPDKDIEAEHKAEDGGLANGGLANEALQRAAEDLGDVPAENQLVRRHVPIMERIDMFAPPPAESRDQPVFVWYEAADFAFLMERVVAPLSRQGVRFLLEDKDFVPGVAKSQNLLQAVAASRCSLLVLSAASLPNEWLLYAYQVALEQHLARRQHRVALLRRRDCPLAALDEELKQALAATAVLEEDSPWFESRLSSLVNPEPDLSVDV